MKTLAVRVPVFHIPPEHFDNNDRSASKLASWLESKGHKHPEPQKITDPRVLNFMEWYILVDRAQSHGEWLAGEIYWLYFKAAPEAQQAFIAALAERNHLELPDLVWTPRQRLIQAVYGRDEGLVEDGDGKFDSKGGKRITAAIRTFLTRAGLRKRKIRADEFVPRKTKEFLSGLFEVAKEPETKVLHRLIARKYGHEAMKALAA